jgi:hypothetical protein
VAVLNDVNYVLKATPRSKALIAHIDKLRAYNGIIPTSWKNTSASIQTEDIGQVPGNITAETNRKLVSNTFSDQRKLPRDTTEMSSLYDRDRAPRSQGDEHTSFRASRLRRPPRCYGW